MIRQYHHCVVVNSINGLYITFCFGNFQLQSFKAEDIKQDYDTGKDGITMVTFKISFDQAEALEEALKTNCSRNLVFYKH